MPFLRTTKREKEVPGCGGLYLQSLASVLEKKLKRIPTEEKVKILAAIYKSLNRHTRGSREHLNYIQQFF
jgi:hypothetical protein